MKGTDVKSGIRVICAHAIAAALAACNASDPNSCKVLCTSDDMCPTGQTCGELGKCTSGEACPCTTGEFLGCTADNANIRTCNAAANGVDTASCGEPGCNAIAQRCNMCVPDSATCSSDLTSLNSCDSSGLPAGSDACAISCVSGQADHCAYLEPAYLPDVCDVVATEPAYLVATDTTIDTSDVATCNGGVIAQTTGREICVLRYQSIDVQAVLRAHGSRPLALVADDSLTVEGMVDASGKDADGNGAGGGSIAAGDRAATDLGGGGAGFRHVGGNGGNATSNGGGGAGGPVVTPSPETTGFIGGTTALHPTPQQLLAGYPDAGPAGGGVMLIACRGTVSIPGTIAVNGGGGRGGKDTASVGVNYVGATGGGSGGLIVLQGLQVSLTGKLYANGGGGGGGCGVDGCTGNDGQDGQLSTAQAHGGLGGNPNGGSGGVGGSRFPPTEGGASGYSPGGGGGAAGRFVIYTPNGVAPVLTPIETSPQLDSVLTVSTR